MTIPYARQHISDEDVEAVGRALRSDWLTTGPLVQDFERHVATVTGTSDAVAVSSGTAALHALYACLQVQKGTDVIVPALTFAATAYPVVPLGGRVLFADIEAEYLSVDVGAVEALLHPRVRVMTAVHYAGVPAAMSRLQEVARANDTHLIEDAAHAIGSTYNDRSVGSLATAAAFSFHAVKTITTGEGGAITTDDADLAAAIRRFRNHGMTRERGELREPDEGPWHQEIQKRGWNYRLTDFQAALGTAQLQRLPEIVAERERLVDRYNQAFSSTEGLLTPKSRPGSHTAWHLYPVRILDGRRRMVFERLQEAGIGVQVHYLPVYRHPLFQDLGYKKGLCPVAERVYEELISLPLYVGLTDGQQDQVIGEMERVLR